MVRTDGCWVRNHTPTRLTYAAKQRTTHVPGPFKRRTSKADSPESRGARVTQYTAASNEYNVVNGTVRMFWCTRRARGMVRIWYPPFAGDFAEAALSPSNAIAFCALSESPSLTRYVLGV
jgi:hypothetical protein